MADASDAGLDDSAWRTTRWVCTEYTQPELAAAIAAREPERFRGAVRAISDALSDAKRTGDFAPVHEWYSCTLTFLSARSPLAAEDVRRLATVSIDIVHACSGDVSAQARWGTMATRIFEIYGKKLTGSIRVEWRPLYDILCAYLAGETSGYNGAIPSAVHVAVMSRLAQKARRHFSRDAPREIWAEIKPKIRALDGPACFEGLGALHLLMPCHRVADEEAGDGTRIPWNTWMSEWVEASRWMPTNRFWLAAWFGIFSRLAKHDARRVVEWSAHAAYLHTVALWFMEVPVGGGEGACPFGRRTPGRAAYLFGRSVNDGERRATYAAKYLAHRVADESASELGDGGRSAPADFEALVDVLENYAHPSNAGRWTQTIALFLSAAVKSFRERCADETRDPPPRPAIRRFARSAARLVSVGMYSKNATMRVVAASTAGQLAYLAPEQILPLVMRRFAEAVDDGSVATHQLAAALGALAACWRPAMFFASKTDATDVTDATDAMDASSSHDDIGDGFASDAVLPSFADLPPPGTFLAAALTATIPGIDANDQSKTLGTIRLYAAAVSNAGVLADPGEEGSDERFPHVWSEWIDALLDRFFAFFENVDLGNAGKSDGADKSSHHGGDGGASYLMGSSSMYSPLMRLLFARMPVRSRERAVKKVARFALSSTHAGLVGEVGQMIMAAATQCPEEATTHLIAPLTEALRAEVEDVARLVQDLAPSDSLAADQIVSPTREARLKWQTGLLGAGLHYGGPRVVRLSGELRGILARLFELCAEAKSLRLGEMGAHLASLLCGAVSGTYARDLFERDGAFEDVSGTGETSIAAKWAASKTTEGDRDDGANADNGDEYLPRAFAWRRPGEEDLALAAALAEELIEAPARRLLATFAPGDDAMETVDGMPKERVRALIAAVGGGASGFRGRMADFAPSPKTLASDTGPADPPTPVGTHELVPPAVGVETRSVAARAIAAAMAGASPDDAETLGMALSVAEDLLAASDRDYHGVKAALRTWHADAVALTQPAFRRGGGGKRRPRWLVGEYAFLRFLWRSSQAIYHAGGPGGAPPGDEGYVALLDATRGLAMSKYKSVRDQARGLVERVMKRFPSATPGLCLGAVEALRATPGDEDRCVAACALLKSTMSVNRLRSDAAHFRAVAEALLASAHHDAAKAQSAVNELFLSIAIRFSRSHLKGPRGTLHPELAAVRETVYALMECSNDEGPEPTRDGDALGGDAERIPKSIPTLKIMSPGSKTHWSYSLMANALLLFLAHPRLELAEMRRLTRYAMSCVLGDAKALRMPATCALLMLSRDAHFAEAGAPELRDALLASPKLLTRVLRNLGLCHYVRDSSSGGGGGQGGGAGMSRADALAQAAESLYGAGADMSGKPWPRLRGAASAADRASSDSGAGHFVVACARLFKLFAAVAPEAFDAPELEAEIAACATVRGDRGARCAAAEALAGALASPALGARAKAWAGPLLTRCVLESAADATEEWLRAVRYAVRGEERGEGAGPEFLRALAEAPDRELVTVAQQARRLETATVCLAQLAESDDADAVRFQASILAELRAPGHATPLAHDSRAVREEAARAAAALIGTHAAPKRDPNETALDRLRDEAEALLADFAEGAAAATREATESYTPRRIGGEVKETSEGAFRAPPGRGQNWLEGAFLTVVQLAKHGDASFAPLGVARLLPHILRAQEAPDRDFALVAKRALAHLKYLVFDRSIRSFDRAGGGSSLPLLLEGVLEGARDPQWHARLAALKFMQAFAFRHAFVLAPSELAALRDAAAARLSDPRIEVRKLAAVTLVGFLRGVSVTTREGRGADGGCGDSAARALRARCLAAAEAGPKRRRRDGGAKTRAGARGEARGEGGDDAEGTGATHGAVLGVAACVLSAPYDVPGWMPAHLETLARWAEEPSPVKESVRWAFGEFKKTHQDTWAQTKAAFTSEQWESIAAGMELAPSYIS